LKVFTRDIPSFGTHFFYRVKLTIYIICDNCLITNEFSQRFVNNKDFKNLRKIFKQCFCYNFIILYQSAWLILLPYKSGRFPNPNFLIRLVSPKYKMSHEKWMLSLGYLEAKVVIYYSILLAVMSRDLRFESTSVRRVNSNLQNVKCLTICWPLTISLLASWFQIHILATIVNVYSRYIINYYVVVFFYFNICMYVYRH
jgi:hypothetical protein